MHEMLFIGYLFVKLAGYLYNFQTKELYNLNYLQDFGGAPHGVEGVLCICHPIYHRFCQSSWGHWCCLLTFLMMAILVFM